MSFLLDTNVLSELARPNCEPQVGRWINSLDEDETFISVISIAELRQGVEFLPRGKRRDAMHDWLHVNLIRRYENRTIGVTADVAGHWGVLAARARGAGGKLPVMDGFIAATAHIHSLTLATRNVRDFLKLGVKFINPWNLSPPATGASP